ncbi:MAG: hypothetical protein ACE5GX_00905 [Thermoanaerobaculia bacterium]
MRSIALLLGLVLLPAAAGADRIRLENGKSFDDVVIVEQTDSSIQFRLASGEMSLPLSWVAEVERTKGALEEYFERKDALDGAGVATGVDWLDLARWARAQGVGHGFREALLMAGELEPQLDGLAPLMASIDFYFKTESGIWSHGRQAPPRSERPAGQGDPPARRTASHGPWDSGTGDVAQGLTRAIERLAEAELERTRARRERDEPVRTRLTTLGTVAYPFIGVGAGFAGSGWIFRGEPIRPPQSDPKDPVIRRPANAQARALLSRPPGSILPLSAFEH